jgi:hypothetical protein
MVTRGRKKKEQGGNKARPAESLQRLLTSNSWRKSTAGLTGGWCYRVSSK